ncbi:hypothetical protein [Paraglaciecola sp.]|uniref:hypothetical protein n=1 Tax=Paraglaciecola sp. TaxID=1920173 RepID=UPI0030F47D20
MRIKLLLFFFSFFAFSTNAEVEIITVNQSPEELKIKADLKYLHEKYDLSSWVYTEKVQVDENSKTPHSHPVLTMSTQDEYLNSKTKLLSTYLHEQFHWHVIINGKPSKDEFRKRIKADFPKVKYGYPYGSSDEDSTLSHIIVCYLEYVALSELFGQQKAREVLSTNDYYKWVYQTITDPKNTDKLDNMLNEFGLEFRVTNN